jgi:hypothetical protein
MSETNDIRSVTNNIEIRADARPLYRGVSA